MRCRAADSVFALALWASVVLCGPQQPCWTAEPTPAPATKPPEEKPEESPPAHDSSPQPVAQMSPEEIYARASPAVVTLKIYNELSKAIFSGSGFLLADQPAKPAQVDVDAKRFAADLMDCDDADELLESIQAKLSFKELAAHPYPAEHNDFLKARREATKRDLPNLQRVYIATNYHVIESAVSIHVRMQDGPTGFASQIIQEDESADVAILLAWLKCEKPPAAVALSTMPPKVGTKIFAIGSPMDLENSLSEGLISGIRELEPGRSVLQTSAAISSGSSGGPILAADGKVVGIATASHPRGQNLNFAVPASEVLRLLEKPPKPREVWRGRSIHREEQYAFDCAEAALKSKEGGNAAAEALINCEHAALLGGKVIFKTTEEAERAIKEGIKSVPHEFKYLAYCYAGEFQYWLGSDARDRRETPAEAAQRAQSDPHYLAALAAYRKAAELKPDFAPAYNGLESIHVSMDEWPEVRLDVDRLMELVPHCAQVYSDRAAYFSHLGQHEAAVKNLKIAADLNPADDGVQLSMAQEYMDLAKYNEAIEAYQQAIRLALPGPPGAALTVLCEYNIGIAHKFAGRYEEAIKAFLRCEATADCPDVWVTRCDEQIKACEAMLDVLGRPSPQ